MTRILLLVELKGGNDGLNTVIPYADPRYRQLRPGLGVARERVLQLDEHVGLHEKLEPLMESWKARDLAIVQGVGYANPNRSHFRSIEIWDTASSSSQTLSEGWVARAFEHAGCRRALGVDSIVIDTNSLPMMGPDLRTIVMQDAENFLRQAQAMKDTPRIDDGGNPALRHLLAVRREVNAAAAGLRDKLRAAPRAGAGLCDRRAARPPARSRDPHHHRAGAGGGGQGGTGRLRHPCQPGADARDGCSACWPTGWRPSARNMIAAGRWDDVLVLTYSEFGRRARQNASGGTDHGTAAPQFVMGGKVKGGLHGV